MRRSGKNSIFFFLVLIIPVLPVAQPIELIISGQKEALNFIDKHYELGKTKFETKFELENQLRSVLKEMWNTGYLEASFDSLNYKDSMHAKVDFHKGKQYQWATLQKGNVNESWLSQIGFRRDIYEGKAFKPKQFSELMDALLKLAEKKGYPFARLRLDNATFQQQQIKGELHLQKGQQYVYGDLELLGDVDVSERYLRNYLSLNEGDVYNEKAIEAIESQLNALNFLQSVDPPEVTFKEGGDADIKLFLDSRNANRIDGILGLMPNSGEGNQFLITGRLDLGLKNPFGKAIGFDLYWEKNQPRTQELNVDFNYPFLFDLPLGVDFNLDLLKFDTLFLNIGTEIGGRYLMKGTNYLRFFFKNRQSNLIGDLEAKEIIDRKGYFGYNTNFYGLEAYFENLDYKLNPTTGYRINIKGSVGTKNLENPDLFKDRRDASPVSNAVIYQARLDFAYFVKIADRSTIKFGLQGKHLEDEQIVFNQLYRFGGLGTLRGFDDKSIFASTYGISTFEYRYLTGKDAFIRAFWDGAYFQRLTIEQKTNDLPYGFGLGYNFRTKAGIFSINYALGKRKNTPLSFRQGKIHFGITNLF